MAIPYSGGLAAYRLRVIDSPLYKGFRGFS